MKYIPTFLLLNRGSLMLLFCPLANFAASIKRWYVWIFWLPFRESGVKGNPADKGEQQPTLKWLCSRIFCFNLIIIQGIATATIGQLKSSHRTWNLSLVWEWRQAERPQQGVEGYASEYFPEELSKHLPLAPERTSDPPFAKSHLIETCRI